MKYSVLIPVYNTESYLRTCVESVLAQTEEDFEIILADDESTDSSPAICDELANIDSRIRVYHKKNERLMMTRRFEIKKAQGDYILFLDSDDYWASDLLINISEVISKHNPDMVIYNYYKLMGDRIEKHPSIFEDGTVFDNTNKRQLIYEGIGNNRLNSMWIKAIKREVLLADKTDYRAYQPIIVSGEDIFQSIPLFFLSQKTVYIDKPLVFYRELANSITTTYNHKKFQIVSVEMKRKIEYLKRYNFWDSAIEMMIKNTAYKKIIHLLFLNVVNSKLPIKEKIYVFKEQHESDFVQEIAKECTLECIPSNERMFARLWRWRMYRFSYVYAKLYHLLRNVGFSFTSNRKSQ